MSNTIPFPTCPTEYKTLLEIGTLQRQIGELMIAQAGFDEAKSMYEQHKETLEADPSSSRHPLDPP